MNNENKNEQGVLTDIKKELTKLIDDSKRYKDGGQKFVIAYRNVLSMIKYAEEGRLDELFIDNCLHKRTFPIYFESDK